jgi:xanthine dehydrogenase YagR molybdenum-binding subunit
MKMIEARADAKLGDEQKKFSMHAFGSQFAEVRVNPDSGEVRVTRWVGSFGVGRILNAKTANSQLIGGIVYGIGMALMEHTVIDPNLGRVVNHDLAEYHVPVNADVPDIEVLFVDEHDPHINPLGVKGIGEIGITGTAAAIANAVYHATGKRVRDLPITLDKLL